MSTFRCSEYVLDKTTKRIRKCKNKKCCNELCTIHYKKLINKNALLIQSVFRGNKIRSKLNNILVKLPDDIQRIIIKNVREDYYNTKKNNIIDKIINNRVLKLLNTGNDVNNRKSSYFLEINKICRLLNKYSSIIKDETIVNLFYLTKMYERVDEYGILVVPYAAVEFVELVEVNYIN